MLLKALEGSKYTNTLHTHILLYIYKWHECPGSYNLNPSTRNSENRGETRKKKEE